MRISFALINAYQILPSGFDWLMFFQTAIYTLWTKCVTSFNESCVFLNPYSFITMPMSMSNHVRKWNWDSNWFDMLQNCLAKINIHINLQFEFISSRIVIEVTPHHVLKRSWVHPGIILQLEKGVNLHFLCS